MSKRRVLYEIHWNDIVCDPGWGKGERQPVRAINVGWLIESPNKKQKKTRRCYRFAATLCPDGEYGDVTTIPEGAMVRMKRLGEYRHPR